MFFSQKLTCYFYLFLLISTYFYLFLPISTYLYLYLSIYLFLSIYLSISIWLPAVSCVAAVCGGRTREAHTASGLLKHVYIIYLNWHIKQTASALGGLVRATHSWTSRV